jgi:hypothetical protein
MMKFLKGSGIHPKMRLFANRARGSMVKAVQDVDKRMQTLNLQRGVGMMETKTVRPVRKPLKFML